MTRFVAIWSLQRGIIDPPEPLDNAGQCRAILEAYNAQEPYRSVRYERDPPLTAEQEWMEELGRRTFPNKSALSAHNRKKGSEDEAHARTRT